MEKLSVQKLYKLDKALYLDTLLSHPCCSKGLKPTLVRRAFNAMTIRILNFSAQTLFRFDACNALKVCEMLNQN